MHPPLDILYTDPWFVAINKPAGMLVHRTRISEDTVFVLQTLRDQIGAPVYTIHRLDRATSGVLVFGTSAEAAEALAAGFREKTMEKKYLAVVRGWTDDAGTVDYAVRDQDKPGAELLPAVTHYRTLGRSEMPYAIGKKYSTARFSLVEAEPETGRRHQIRKHFAHILHPIITDKRHGDNKHNRYFGEQFGFGRLLLHATTLAFTHPYTGEPLRLQAPVDAEFIHGLELTGLSAFLPGPAMRLQIP